MFFCIYYTKKRNSIPSSEIKCQKSGILLIIIGWGESGEVILQVSIAGFRALSKKFSGKDGSAPLEKIGPYAYEQKCRHKMIFHKLL